MKKTLGKILLGDRPRQSLWLYRTFTSRCSFIGTGTAIILGLILGAFLLRAWLGAVDDAGAVVLPMEGYLGAEVGEIQHFDDGTASVLVTLTQEEDVLGSLAMAFVILGIMAGGVVCVVFFLMAPRGSCALLAIQTLAASVGQREGRHGQIPGW